LAFADSNLVAGDSGNYYNTIRAFFFIGHGCRYRYFNWIGYSAVYMDRINGYVDIFL